MTDGELVSQIKKYDSAVIFGHGDIGKYLFEVLSECGLQSIIYCDNNHMEQDRESIPPVFTVEAAVAEMKDALFLTTGYHFADAMKEQLMQLGISSDSIINGITVEADEYVKKLRGNIHRTQLKRIRFEVDLVQHCNLNCECCSQFSPISPERFLDVNIMERDFRRLSELFDGTASRIYLIGGEPLLHPELIKCLRIAGKYFPNGNVSVFTNGLLLPKMKDEFWRAMREEHIGITTTKYPLKIDYEELKKKANCEKVEFAFFGTSEDYKYMTSIGMDVTGSQSVEKSFDTCTEANNCIKLSNGRLYTCTRPVAIWKFNEFFNENLQVAEEDSIDIFKAKSADEILAFLSRPIPFCRYCNTTGERSVREWAVSKKEMSEWV